MSTVKLNTLFTYDLVASPSFDSVSFEEKADSIIAKLRSEDRQRIIDEVLEDLEQIENKTKLND